MDLVVNGPAIAASSRGVRRYCQAVLQHLAWPGKIETVPAGRWPALERPVELLRRGRPDAIFWTPCQRGPFHAHHHVVTVHDCINVEYTYAKDWRLPVFRRLSQTVLGGAECVVAISHATKAALLRNYRLDEARIVVIPSSDEVFSIGAAPTAAVSDEAFVLMVTNRLPHKNGLAACTAFGRSAAARSGWTLRVVGSLPDDALQACRQAGVDVQVRHDVRDDQLATWYRDARFLLSPSLSEGHNLTIAEALAAGGRVLCSDIAAHREFYDGRVRFFDPLRCDAIADAIDHAVAEPPSWFPVGIAALQRPLALVAGQYRELFLRLSGDRP